MIQNGSDIDYSQLTKRDVESFLSSETIDKMGYKSDSSSDPRLYKSRFGAADAEGIKLSRKGSYPINTIYSITTSEVFLKGNNPDNEIKSKQMAVFSNRMFSLFINNPDYLTCFSYSVITVEDKITNVIYFIKFLIKIAILSGAYFILWVYISVFIQSIYTQYGKRTFDICIVPLLSMLVIDPFFTSNILMFVTALILYFRGENFLIKKKKNLFDQIVFRGFVPPHAVNHFEAIYNFRLLYK